MEFMLVCVNARAYAHVNERAIYSHVRKQWSLCACTETMGSMLIRISALFRFLFASDLNFDVVMLKSIVQVGNLTNNFLIRTAEAGGSLS